MNVFWRINELNQANGKAQALLKIREIREIRVR